MLIEQPGAAYNIVIVGSGPAGLSLAERLAVRGVDNILLVESGLSSYNAEQNRLARVTANGDMPADYFSRHNPRVFGGASLVWGGYCAMLELRSFEDGSWPIPYTELQRYYPDAARILELPTDAWDSPTVPIEGNPDLVYRPFYLSSPVRFGQKYAPFIADTPAISLVTGHTLTRLETAGDKVSELLLRNTQGQEKRVRAERVILATGGIQNARLLLESGLGGEHCGLHFVDHPHIFGFGRIMVGPEIVRASRRVGGTRADALQPTDAFCRRHGIPSFSMQIDGRRDPDGLDDVGNAMLQLKLDVIGEMASDNGNRVTLSDTQKDDNGLPVAAIDYRFDYRDTAKRTWTLIGESLLRSGLGRVSSYSEEYRIIGGGHLMSTTRMAAQASQGVVDPNCRVYGVENLYVAGSSVFPTAGAVNPTYTIVALALRLGDHLAGAEANG